MPIKFACQGCNKTITVNDQMAGKRAKCPGCQSPITIPTASAAPPTKPVAATAPAPAKPVPSKPTIDDDDIGLAPFDDGPPKPAAPIKPVVAKPAVVPAKPTTTPNKPVTVSSTPTKPAVPAASSTTNQPTPTIKPATKPVAPPASTTKPAPTKAPSIAKSNVDTAQPVVSTEGELDLSGLDLDKPTSSPVPVKNQGSRAGADESGRTFGEAGKTGLTFELEPAQPDLMALTLATATPHQSAGQPAAIARPPAASTYADPVVTPQRWRLSMELPIGGTLLSFFKNYFGSIGASLVFMLMISSVLVVYCGVIYGIDLSVDNIVGTISARSSGAFFAKQIIRCVLLLLLFLINAWLSRGYSILAVASHVVIPKRQPRLSTAPALLFAWSPS